MLVVVAAIVMAYLAVVSTSTSSSSMCQHAMHQTNYSNPKSRLEDMVKPQGLE